jgi:energy-coupling factor transporter ATP-binding protein EcfA2
MVGQNGCGKSSLILALAGVIPEYILESLNLNST